MFDVFLFFPAEALGRLLRHSGDYGALNLGGVRLHAVGMFFNGEE